ncbi:Lnb N-terminal periplasmic domain-containing protein [Cobetia sp. L2A1]|uniref:Lnb N-terminal periplasmic domain-containing protein n=1 Tax=Cobetia sp. L2A1 TaxID=2686360 RepID=UPI00131D342C|nr:DUF4105 domain-containing protein [Cobetia sp. L2A1]
MSLTSGIARAALSLTMLGAAVWLVPALWFRLPGPEALRISISGLVAVLALLCVVALWWPSASAIRWRLAGGYLMLLVASVAWWHSITPQADRDWAPEVEHLVEGHVIKGGINTSGINKTQGDILHLDRVRNFEWHTAQDFTPHWESREYPLDELRSVDLLTSHWMGPQIAHTLVSFGFSDGRYLTFSVEIRKERDEQFSTLGGMFKQYELAVIAAEESDIVRVRSNVRGEEVHLYRVQMPQAMIRELLLAYVDESEALHSRPHFYNTAFSNCTTLVYAMMTRLTDGLPLDYRLLLSGYLPEYVADQDALSDVVPFDALKARSLINPAALAADQQSAGDFSRLIREGIPGADRPSF